MTIARSISSAPETTPCRRRFALPGVFMHAGGVCARGVAQLTDITDVLGLR